MRLKWDDFYKGVALGALFLQSLISKINHTETTSFTAAGNFQLVAVRTQPAKVFLDTIGSLAHEAEAR